jgi:hypothetical protein
LVEVQRIVAQGEELQPALIVVLSPAEVRADQTIRVGIVGFNLLGSRRRTVELDEAMLSLSGDRRNAFGA